MLLLQLPLVLLGGSAGWGVKWWYDRRSRQRMRTILQAEAQRPFVSAPPGSWYGCPGGACGVCAVGARGDASLCLCLR